MSQITLFWYISSLTQINYSVLHPL